jgi:hypothetical protein
MLSKEGQRMSLTNHFRINNLLKNMVLLLMLKPFSHTESSKYVLTLVTYWKHTVRCHNCTNKDTVNFSYIISICSHWLNWGGGTYSNGVHILWNFSDITGFNVNFCRYKFDAKKPITQHIPHCKIRYYSPCIPLNKLLHKFGFAHFWSVTSNKKKARRVHKIILRQ